MLRERVTERETDRDVDGDTVGCKKRQFCQRSLVSTVLHTELRVESSMRSVWPMERALNPRFQKLRFANRKLAPRLTSQYDVLSTLMSIVQKKESRLPSTAELALQTQRKLADVGLLKATLIPIGVHASISAKFMPAGEPGVFSTRMKRTWGLMGSIEPLGRTDSDEEAERERDATPPLLERDALLDAERDALRDADGDRVGVTIVHCT
jgi:hypothetical protein